MGLQDPEQHISKFDISSGTPVEVASSGTMTHQPEALWLDGAGTLFADGCDGSNTVKKYTTALTFIASGLTGGGGSYSNLLYNGGHLHRIRTDCNVEAFTTGLTSVATLTLTTGDAAFSLSECLGHVVISGYHRNMFEPTVSVYSYTSGTYSLITRATAASAHAYLQHVSEGPYIFTSMIDAYHYDKAAGVLTLVASVRPTSWATGVYGAGLAKYGDCLYVNESQSPIGGENKMEVFKWSGGSLSLLGDLDYNDEYCWEMEKDDAVNYLVSCNYDPTDGYPGVLLKTDKWSQPYVIVNMTR